MRIPSGVTDQYIYFVAVDPTDLKSRETGLSSFTVYRSRNGGTATLYTTPTTAELSSSNMPGVYSLLLDEDMTIGSGNDSEEMVLHITHGSMAPVTRVIELYRPKITAGYTLGVGSDGDLLEVNTLTGHTAQTGDSYARLGAPAGASIAADLLVIDNFVDDIESRLGTPSNLGSGATVAGNLVDIEAQTDDIGAAGAGLTAIPWNSSWDAEVESEVQDVVGAAGASLSAIPWNSSWDTEVQSEVADALDAPVPGTPTADSINDRVKALDDAYTSVRAGYLDELGPANLPSDVDAILADTDELQTDDVPGLIAALNDLSTSDVNTEVAAALATYDPPTKTEMDNGFAALNDPAAADIADAVWDELATGHTDAGKAGQQLWTDVDAILADTEVIDPNVGTCISQLASMQTKIGTIQDLGSGNTIGFNLADIESQTDDIGASGAGLSAIPWNSAWDAEVNSEVADVLKTDTISEMSQQAPPATPTFEEAVMYLYMALRNKIDVTSSLKEFHNDSGTVIWKKTLSDDATTYTEAEGVSGP